MAQLEATNKMLEKQLKTAEARTLDLANRLDREMETFNKYKEENRRLKTAVVR